MAEGRGWNKEKMCKASYTYGTLYCTPFRYSYGCFGFRFDFLRSYTQRKQPQLSTSKGPRQSHIDRPHFSGACCAVLHRATDRQELLWRRGDHGFSLKNTTVSSTDYTATGKLHREDTLATSAAERCGVTWLELSNKAYSWRSLKTSVHKKKKMTKHF